MLWSLSITVSYFLALDGLKMFPIEQLKDSKKVFPSISKARVPSHAAYTPSRAQHQATCVPSFPKTSSHALIQ